ncbi:hypothetical protein NKJ04_17550 [Mesorhizobium sp. M0618]|uniref:hypothetical protein n=1 Tax=Mesorhizobium sp. M0618 TaxID=2956972 RepID=UPI00333C8084
MTDPKSSDNLFAGVLKTATTETAAAPATPAATPAPAPEAEVEEPAAPQISQLDMLKSRARLMGVTFSNNISVEALKKKIDSKLAGEAESQEETKDEEPAVETKAAPTTAPVKSLRAIQLEEQMKLVRLRITNLDPKKKDLPGEILTVANRFIGTVRKYVPYGEVTENGWHVPQCIYQMLKDREFLNIRVRKGSKGQEIIETTWAREFALEVLEPLTQVELARLAAAQAAGNNID